MNQDIVHQEYGKNSIFLQTQVGTQSVTGIFRCDIIDSNSQMQQVYIGVYLQPETRERIIIVCLVFISTLHAGAHIISPITFNLIDDVIINFVLNCTSMGGPVNQMVWLLNDTSVPNSSPYPILADAEEGLYYNTLHVHGRMNGIYCCKITDPLTVMMANYTVESKYVISP